MPKQAPLTETEQYNKDIASIFALERHWRPIHDACTKRVEFLLDGKHYEDDDADEYEMSSRTVRWVGQETKHVYRHVKGVVAKPASRMARPVDSDGPDAEENAALAEVATSFLEAELDNPAKEFEDTMEDVVGSAAAAGYGVAWLDYLPGEGPWGELIATCDDPRNFMCDPRVRSIHDPRCRRVVRIVRMTLGEARERARTGGWNADVVEQLKPDPGRDIQSLATNSSRSDGLIHLGRSDSGSSEYSDDDEFTCYYLWERKSKKTRTQRDFKEYADGERYLRCHTCAYRSASEADLRKADKLVGELPDMLEGGCPECMARAEQQPGGMAMQPRGYGDLHRVDGEELRQELLAYPEGRLVILAPYSGVRENLFDGPWPWKLRSYPAMFLPYSRHPFKITGSCITDDNWWNQTATDMLMRLVLERLLNTAPVWVSPLDGLEDARGNRFEFSDDNGWNAYYEGTQFPRIELIGGDPGIPASWSPAYQYARQGLTSHTGVADFSLSEGQSRDIPASSVSQQIQQEEVPQADFRRRYLRQRSLFESVYYDFQRATYPPERVMRLRGSDGQYYMRQMAASDMPNFDFWLDDNPEMKPQDQREAAATQLIIQAIQTTPWAVDLLAHANHFSPSIVRKAKQDFARWQSEQQQQAAQAQAQAQQRQLAARMQGGPGPQAANDSPSSMVARLLGGLTPQSAQTG